MNAFTVEMAQELIDAINRASEDDAVRAIVVTGAGKAFCADEARSPCVESAQVAGSGTRVCGGASS